MDLSAALLNDPSRTRYTYVKQIPYLNIAMNELQEMFEQNNLPVTDVLSAVIPIDSGVAELMFRNSDPHLPNDLIEPQFLWERTRGIDPFVPMNRISMLDKTIAGTQVSQLNNYVWSGQKLHWLPANGDNDIKIQYIRALFTKFLTENDPINIINAKSFLWYRNAALCAEFIGENKTRADSLNTDATLAIDRALGIETKGNQAFNVRHRPFRSGYKHRSYT